MFRGGPGGRRRRVPSEGMLLLVALLPRRRPDDEDWEQLLCVDGTTRLAGPNPVIHTPHEPLLDFRMRKKRRRPAHTEDEGDTSTSSCLEATQVVPRTARDTSNPSCSRTQRRQMSAKVHRTTCAQAREMGRSRTTLASRPLTKVSASPRRRSCDRRGATTLDCRQWISSVVTPNRRKSASLE